MAVGDEEVRGGEGMYGFEGGGVGVWGKGVEGFDVLVDGSGDGAVEGGVWGSHCIKGVWIGFGLWLLDKTSRSCACWVVLLECSRQDHGNVDATHTWLAYKHGHSEQHDWSVQSSNS